MNSHFNRQFILIDFRLVKKRAFLKFLGSSEFATYLVLRMNIWRGPTVHYMGLQDLYERQKKLVCSLTREKIAKTTGVAVDNISRHLSTLEQKGAIRRVRTGRQNIYVLGEWVDVYGDGSYKVEWFYMEGRYGVSKSDLTASVRSENDVSARAPSDQTRRLASDNNREENREENTVSNGDLKSLADLKQPFEKVEYVAQTILNQLGDTHSRKFYHLVAAKVPEAAIRIALAEVKADGAHSPARLFTHKMKLYALKQSKAAIGRPC